MQNIGGAAIVSITSAGEIEGCYDLDTGPENICIDSAVLASTIRNQPHLPTISLHPATIPHQVFALSVVERPQLRGPVDWCEASMAHPRLSVLTRNK